MEEARLPLTFFKEVFFIDLNIINMFIMNQTPIDPFNLLVGGKDDTGLQVSKTMIGNESTVRVDVFMNRGEGDVISLFDMSFFGNDSFNVAIFVFLLQREAPRVSICCGNLFIRIFDDYDKCSSCIQFQSSAMKTNDSKDMCSICLEPLNERYVVRICHNNHFLHSQCASNYCSKKDSDKCPICKQPRFLFN